MYTLLRMLENRTFSVFEDIFEVFSKLTYMMQLKITDMKDT